MGMFSDLLDKTIRATGLKDLFKKTKKWFSDKVNRVRLQKDITASAERSRRDMLIGGMYQYFYDSKWKKTLPYYDKFPLLIPLNFYDDGFLGLNLHYLPPKQRAVLFEAIIETANNKRFDETTKLNVTYKILKNASKMKAFKPCIKRYLYNHLRSAFIIIHPDEWINAIFLPTARFEKAKKEQVWKESMSKI